MPLTCRLWINKRRQRRRRFLWCCLRALRVLQALMALNSMTLTNHHLWTITNSQFSITTLLLLSTNDVPYNINKQTITNMPHPLLRVAVSKKVNHVTAECRLGKWHVLCNSTPYWPRRGMSGIGEWWRRHIGRFVECFIANEVQVIIGWF